MSAKADCRRAAEAGRVAAVPGVRIASYLAAACCVLALAGCGTFSGGDRPAGSRGGGYYLDDGPGDNPPANLDEIPDAVPRAEPLVRGTARPYVAFGRRYVPMTQLAPYRERGIASWYGRRYHGNRTASGEPYDMYAMTAAHPVLPIPSYARVTNLNNGRSVIVRINDRGPFLGNRLIDLSYAAAYKLDILRNGSAPVEVEAILPGSESVQTAAAPAQEPLATASATTMEPEAAPERAANAPPDGAFYLQLGAFSLRDNAERFVERMRTALDGSVASLTVVASGSLHRVHAGPYASREAALQAADQITTVLGAAPLLVAPR